MVTVTNPRAREAPTPENPRGYPAFDIAHVRSYSNQQIHYYYTTGAIAPELETRFQDQLRQRKTTLDLMGQNGDSDTEQPPPNNTVPSRTLSTGDQTLSFEDDGEL